MRSVNWARRVADESLFAAYLERLKTSKGERLCIKDRFGYLYRPFEETLYRRDLSGKWSRSKHRPMPPFRLTRCFLPLPWALRRLRSLPDGSEMLAGLKSTSARLTKENGKAVLSISGVRMEFDLGSDEELKHAERKLMRLMGLAHGLRKAGFTLIGESE